MIECNSFEAFNIYQKLKDEQFKLNKISEFICLFHC